MAHKETYTLIELLIVLALVALPAQLLAASLNIELISFHGATHNSYNEDWPEDTGGVIHVFVRNAGAAADGIAALTLNGATLDSWRSQGVVKWWRFWPPSVPAGGVAVATIKTVKSPFGEGQAVTAWVQSAAGATTQVSTTLNTFRLRIGSVIPSQDMKTVQINLRNLDDAAYTINAVYLNDNVTARCTFVGGQTVAGKTVGIIKAAFDQPQPPLKFFAVCIYATRAGGGTLGVGAPVRLVEPWFPLGTWNSHSLNGSETGMQQARAMQIDATWDYSDWTSINSVANRYFIRTLNDVVSGSPGLPSASQVSGQKDNPSILAWALEDEPELHGNPSSQVLDRNNVCWPNDPNHPTYLNLNTNHAFNEYGWIADIVSMDHYVMYAPNVIPGTAVTRKAELPEALDYTATLKENTEPTRMWVWSQLAADSVWSGQPEPWGVNYQFWAHVMAGAKGVFWFLYLNDWDTKYPSQSAMARQVTREFSQIRNLCLYGESMDNIGQSNQQVKVRGIYGEQAMAVIVINNNIDYGLLPFVAGYAQNPASTTLTVPVPPWLPIERIHHVTQDGLVPAGDTSINGQTVTINASLTNSSLIYLIGRHDGVPPEVPAGLNIAQKLSPTSFILSWKEPFDNFGVMGYRVYRNGTEVANVRAPIIRLANILNPTDAFTVRAYDAEGNLGPASNPARLQNPPATLPMTENWNTGSIDITKWANRDTVRNVVQQVSGSDYALVITDSNSWRNTIMYRFPFARGNNLRFSWKAWWDGAGGQGSMDAGFYNAFFDTISVDNVFNNIEAALTGYYAGNTSSVGPYAFCATGSALWGTPLPGLNANPSPWLPATSKSGAIRFRIILGNSSGFKLEWTINGTNWIQGSNTIGSTASGVGTSPTVYLGFGGCYGNSGDKIWVDDIAVEDDSHVVPTPTATATPTGTATAIPTTTPTVLTNLSTFELE